ncbi:MAG: VWA domain-containing protein [Lutibacter sp.]|jgi:nitric oxide reductase NorD protein|nr:VWA domain-containing protein [Lutibacter sp.]
MFEPDEYLFTKLAYYLKKRRKDKQQRMDRSVFLKDLKPQLTVFARAVTGKSIELYEAVREGGYKGTSFFLPGLMSDFPTAEDNKSFYLFRVLYLSVQHNLGLNWNDTQEHDLLSSRQQALETAPRVCAGLFEQFPVTEAFHQTFYTFYSKAPKQDHLEACSFIYGKWMRNPAEVPADESLKTPTGQAVKKKEDLTKTLVKSAAVEEIISVQVDLKQQEDAVLQHQFEKVETAESFDGNFRDFDGSDELEDHANALEDLEMKYTVRVDDTAHSVYQTDFIENATVSECMEQAHEGYYLSYDEWDYAKRRYRENHCKVYPSVVLETRPDYYHKTLHQYRSTLAGLRKMLSTVHNKYQLQRRQAQGDQFDIDALTDLFVEVHSGHSPSEKIYLSKRKKEKDLSILLLLDVSLSSDSYAAGNKVIDVEKQVSVLFGEILDEFHIDFSVNCFNSQTRNHTRFQTLKAFDEDWQRAKYKVGSVEPSGYTRIGAALRHAGTLLDERSTSNKWIVLISDGKPNDYDRYEGKYGINDVKQALRELNERQINSYALAVEAQAKYYLPQMFGQNHYQILTSPVALLTSLVKLYEKIRHQS